MTADKRHENLIDEQVAEVAEVELDTCRRAGIHANGTGFGSNAAGVDSHGADVDGGGHRV